MSVSTPVKSAKPYARLRTEIIIEILRLFQEAGLCTMVSARVALMKHEQATINKILLTKGTTNGLNTLLFSHQFHFIFAILQLLLHCDFLLLFFILGSLSMESVPIFMFIELSSACHWMMHKNVNRFELFV